MANFKEKMRNFMMNRSGADNLSGVLIGAGIALTVISLILNLFNNTVCSVIAFILNLLGLAMLIICVFRMFSKNKAKRQEENRRYIAASEKAKTELHQAGIRFRNRKQYKYFKCPNCKVRMRLPRGSGIVTVTCKRCKNSFTQKS